MHALLGLAASDLMQQDPSLITFAMSHRLKAIRAIKKRLSEMSRTTEVRRDESNAMVATCFALTFQSVQLDDGMAEYMAFVRGILIVSMQMWMKGMSPIFTNMMSDDAEGALAPFMQSLPLIQTEWSDMALVAIQNLRPLCFDEVEIEYHELLLDWVQKLFTSSFDGTRFPFPFKTPIYLPPFSFVPDRTNSDVPSILIAYKALRHHYGWWMMLPHDKFRRIIDPANQVMILLATHWIALKQIMAFITEVEDMARQKRPSNESGKAEPIDPGLGRWLKYLNRQVDFEHRLYNTWPMWVEEQLDRDVTFFGRSR